MLNLEMLIRIPLIHGEQFKNYIRMMRKWVGNKNEILSRRFI